jgi:hypothetical protein
MASAKITPNRSKLKVILNTKAMFEKVEKFIVWVVMPFSGSTSEVNSGRLKDVLRALEHLIPDARIAPHFGIE